MGGAHCFEEIASWVDAVELGRFEERAECCGNFGAALRFRAEVIATANDWDEFRALRRCYLREFSGHRGNVLAAPSWRRRRLQHYRC